MSMHVVGFKPADEQWKKMKAAWDACKTAGVDPPQTVTEYFDGNDPGDAPGMEVDIFSVTGLLVRSFINAMLSIEKSASPNKTILPGFAG